MVSYEKPYNPYEGTVSKIIVSPVIVGTWE